MPNHIKTYNFFKFKWKKKWVKHTEVDTDGKKTAADSLRREMMQNNIHSFKKNNKSRWVYWQKHSLNKMFGYFKIE